MAKEASIRGILSKVGFSRKADGFSVVRIERILAELEIKAYEFDFQPRVIKLRDEADLMKVMLHFMPQGIQESGVAIAKLSDDMTFRVGSWQFEIRS